MEHLKVECKKCFNQDSSHKRGGSTFKGSRMQNNSVYFPLISKRSR